MVKLSLCIIHSCDELQSYSITTSPTMSALRVACREITEIIIPIIIEDLFVEEVIVPGLQLQNTFASY